MAHNLSSVTDTPPTLDALHMTHSTLSLEVSQTLPSPTAAAGTKSPSLVPLPLPLPSLPLTREALQNQPRMRDDVGVRHWLEAVRKAPLELVSPRDSVAAQFDTYRSMPYLRSPPGGRMIHQGSDRIPKLPTLSHSDLRKSSTGHQ